MKLTSLAHAISRNFAKKGPVAAAEAMRKAYPKQSPESEFRIGRVQLPNIAAMLGIEKSGLANGGYAALLVYPGRVMIPSRGDILRGEETLYALAAIGEILQHLEFIESNRDMHYLNWDEKTIEASEIFSWEAFLPDALLKNRLENGWDSTHLEYRYALSKSFVMRRLAGIMKNPDIFNYPCYATNPKAFPNSLKISGSKNPKKGENQ